MKRPILITFTKAGSPQVYSDTISVEINPATPLANDANVRAMLYRKFRKFTRTPATVVSWQVAEPAVEI